MNPEDEKRLNRLLGQLGSAKVEPGFEHRTLRGVEARLAIKRPARTMVWAFGLASVYAATVVVALLYAPAHQSSVIQDLNLRPVANRQNAELAAPRSQSHDSRPEPLEPGPVKVRHDTARPVLPTGPSAPPDALVSFPAPPLPLTEQEKLLLRVVHQGDPVEMAMLDPAVREQLGAEDSARFKEFFKAPPPQPTAEELVKALETKQKGEER